MTDSGIVVVAQGSLGTDEESASIVLSHKEAENSSAS